MASANKNYKYKFPHKGQPQATLEPKDQAKMYFTQDPRPLRTGSIHAKIGAQIQKQKNLRRNIQYQTKQRTERTTLATTSTHLIDRSEAPDNNSKSRLHEPEARQLIHKRVKNYAEMMEGAALEIPTFRIKSSQGEYETSASGQENKHGQRVGERDSLPSLASLGAQGYGEGGLNSSNSMSKEQQSQHQDDFIRRQQERMQLQVALINQQKRRSGAVLSAVDGINIQPQARPLNQPETAESRARIKTQQVSRILGNGSVFDKASKNRVVSELLGDKNAGTQASGADEQGQMLFHTIQSKKGAPILKGKHKSVRASLEPIGAPSHLNVACKSKQMLPMKENIICVETNVQKRQQQSRAGALSGAQSPKGNARQDAFLKRRFQAGTSHKAAQRSSTTAEAGDGSGQRRPSVKPQTSWSTEVGHVDNAQGDNLNMSILAGQRALVGYGQNAPSTGKPNQSKSEPFDYIKNNIKSVGRQFQSLQQNGMAFALDSSRAKVPNRFRKQPGENEDQYSACYGPPIANLFQTQQAERKSQSHVEARDGEGLPEQNDSIQCQELVQKHLQHDSTESLSDLSSRTRTIILEPSALRTIQDTLDKSSILKDKGPQSMADPSFFNPYVEQNSHLKQLSRPYDRKRSFNTLISSKVYEKNHQNQTIGAVPHAINTGAKYMLFRPFTKTDIANYEKFHKYDYQNFQERRNSINEDQEAREAQEKGKENPKMRAPKMEEKPKMLQQLTDKGYYYKFNCQNEIKLVKYTLEDNGFCPLGAHANANLGAYVSQISRVPPSVSCNISDWIIMWTTKVLKNVQFNKLQKYQKVNQFPKSSELTRKDCLIRRIRRMEEIHGQRNYDFLPKTFILPKEHDQLKFHMDMDPNQWWIIKPSSSSQGKGIIITNKSLDLAQKKEVSMIASHYIPNPLLIDGLKFDLRIYVAVTSIYPLRIYMYDEGLTRFATTPYVPPQVQDNLNNREGKYVHLTNYSINKLNKKAFIQNSSADDDIQGSKWSLRGFRKVLAANEIDDKMLWSKMKDIIIKTFISVEPVMNSAFQMHIPHRNNCFQLFGFDILIDDKLNPWLLEVNLSPSLSCDSPLDQKIKGNMLSDLLNLAGIGTFEHHRGQNQGANDLNRNEKVPKRFHQLNRSPGRSLDNNSNQLADLNITNNAYQETILSEGNDRLNRSMGVSQQANQIQKDDMQKGNVKAPKKKAKKHKDQKQKCPQQRTDDTQQEDEEINPDQEQHDAAGCAPCEESQNDQNQLPLSGASVNPPQDSSTKKTKGSSQKNHSVLNNSVYLGGTMTHAMLHYHSLAAATAANFQHFSNYGRMPFSGNSQTYNRNHELILRESEAEFKRKGQFALIFPSHQSSICLYKNLFEQRESCKESLNYLLHQRFLERGIYVLQRKEEEIRDQQYIERSFSRLEGQNPYGRVDAEMQGEDSEPIGGHEDIPSIR